MMSLPMVVHGPGRRAARRPGDQSVRACHLITVMVPARLDLELRPGQDAP
jgi:hypothetical protein